MAPESTRTVAVTGISSGIGRSLAVRLARAGHRVFGCARNADALAELGEACPEIDREVLDVAADDGVGRWAARVIARAGAPDLLLNNAAVINSPAPMWAVPAAEFDRVIAINLSGVQNCVRHFVPAMVAAGRGVIVNLSSGWGRSTSPDVGPYCTTKWGIEGYSRALADDLPPGLASIALNPGIIDTAMLRTCWGGEAGRYESPDTWAERAAPFLLALGAGDNGRAHTVP